MRNYDNLIIISNSRSGHNFIKINFLSWLGVLEEDDFYKSKNNYRGFKYLNLENSTPYMLKQKMHSAGINPNSNNLILTVIRDYLNWLASYTLLCRDAMNRKNPYADFTMIDPSISLWVKLAKFIFEEKNKNGIISVNYDCFRKREDYRKLLCSKIGGNYNENFLYKVTKQGFFSSFDGKKHKNNSLEMNLDERYLMILDTDEAQIYMDALRRNPEALGIYLKHFNVDDKKRNFIQENIGDIKYYPEKKICCS